MTASPDAAPPSLDRTVTLPALIFYGLGVTVGAGIFALIGETLGLAGDHAPLSFLVAGVLVGFTGFSYMVLVGAFPRAGGEAVYVTRGLGPAAGRIAGLAVVATGVITGTRNGGGTATDGDPLVRDMWAQELRIGLRYDIR